MFERFKEHVLRNFPEILKYPVILAISGGIDSIVLSDLLYRLDVSMIWAHCNFKLRGKESKEDEEFVIREAAKRDIPVVIKRFQTARYARKNGLSIQVAARELRYSWFREIRISEGINRVLTAHHLNDSLETFLINLSRGTGLDGLTGIPCTNDGFIRPLLPFCKQEIANYALERELSWREDSTNLHTYYLRNKIRHTVIPELMSVNPSFMANFAKTQMILNEIDILVKGKVAEVRSLLFNKVQDTYEVPIDLLAALTPQNSYLYELFSPYGFYQPDAINELLTSQSGKYLLSSSHKLIKNRKTIIIQQLNFNEKDENLLIFDNSSTLSDGRTLKLTTLEKHAENSSHTIFVDKEKLSFPMLLRNWKEGDFFYPLGLGGKKKLSKYFKDEKLSLVDKEKQLVLVSGENIVWVVGMRMDDRYKVNPKTKSVLQISIT